MTVLKVKKFLNEIMQAELKPIRERREELAKDLTYIYDILRQGTEKAEAVAAQTLDEVKSAMKINYFKDKCF